jgi:hypothetical protein
MNACFFSLKGGYTMTTNGQCVSIACDTVPGINSNLLSISGMREKRDYDFHIVGGQAWIDWWHKGRKHDPIKIPIDEFPAGRCWIARAFIAEDYSVARNAVMAVFNSHKNGERWQRWHGEYITQPLQPAPQHNHSWESKYQHHKSDKDLCHGAIGDILIAHPGRIQGGRNDWAKSSTDLNMMISQFGCQDMHGNELALASAKLMGEFDSSCNGIVQGQELENLVLEHCGIGMEYSSDGGDFIYQYTKQCKESATADGVSSSKVTTDSARPTKDKFTDCYETEGESSESGIKSECESWSEAELLETALSMMDADVRATKQGMPPRERRMTELEFHKRCGHAGGVRGTPCITCIALRGKIGRVYKKQDPFIPTAPGVYMVLDTICFDTVSRHGNIYCTVTRDLGTGYYMPLVWTERRSDIPRKWESMLKRQRRSPIFRKLGHKLCLHLSGDLAGEWGPKAKKWDDMCDRNGIEMSWVSPQDKRAAAFHEVSVRHIEIMIKSILLDRHVPPMFMEEAGEQARTIRNCMCLVRDVDTADGETTTPADSITAGLRSRKECRRRLHHKIPLGTPCLIYTPKVKASQLYGTSCKWVVAIGQVGNLPVFMCPWTGAYMHGKDYYEHQLPRGINFYEFLSIPTPKVNKAGHKVRPKCQPETHVITLKGLDELMQREPDVEHRTIRWRGENMGKPLVRTYLRDKDSGKVYTHDAEGEFDRTNPSKDEIGPEPELSHVESQVDQRARAPIKRKPSTLTEREIEIQNAEKHPEIYHGTRILKKFTQDGRDFGDFEGMITNSYRDPEYLEGTKWLWRVEYDEDDGIDEFDLEDLQHYVFDRYVTPKGWDADKAYKRGEVAPPKTTGGVHPAPNRRNKTNSDNDGAKQPEQDHLRGKTDPYSRVTAADWETLWSQRHYRPRQYARRQILGAVGGW